MKKVATRTFSLVIWFYSFIYVEFKSFIRKLKEDVSATLSLKIYFVNAVECS